MELHNGITFNTIEFNGIPCNNIEFNGNSMLLRGIECCCMVNLHRGRNRSNPERIVLRIWLDLLNF
jgi:hypothetical protein